ncbi:MAG: hypothetical protein CMI60_12020 [Parvibaculum sp.]|jgi:cytoskeletal protein CcmA (bactofilin family)|nr:hypothetical protein [Parvibaculum sp.]|tara:strand:+ start:8295 stop:9293 length:999 start_codon:yes stop_codon:yes gene_type:complete
MIRTALASLLFVLMLSPSLAMAEESAVRWQSEEALFLAGADVVISENVDSDLRASGDSIVIADDVTVDGDVWLAGRRIVVDGTVYGDLDIRGQSVLLNGPVDGDVSVWAVDLVLGPDTEINGNLSYYTSSSAEIAEDARVEGETESHFFSDEGGVAPETPEDWRGRWEDPGSDNVTLELTLPGALILAIFAGILVFLAPRWSDKLQLAAVDSPALAIFYGLVWMLGLPVVAVFAAFTIIGLPFAFLLIVLYGVVFGAGMVTAAIILGGFLVDLAGLEFGDGPGRRLALVVVGALVLWAGAGVPLLGGFFWFASIALGIGGILIAGRVRYEAL